MIQRSPLVSQITLIRPNILLSTQTHQPILKKVYPQRLATRHEHVDSEIELLVLDEERFADVVLSYAGEGCVDFGEFAGEVNSAALAAGVWGGGQGGRGGRGERSVTSVKKIGVRHYCFGRVNNSERTRSEAKRGCVGGPNAYEEE